MVVRRRHGRRLTRGRRSPESPVPAGPGAGELAGEVDGECAEAAVGVGFVVVGVTGGRPAGLLLDEGVRPQ